MHISKFPPMAGGSSDGHGHEVVCIEAKRVCDFCFQEHRVDRTFPVPTSVVIPPNTRPMVDCRIDEQNITCRTVEQKQVDCKKDQTLVCLAIEVPVIITVGDTEFTERVMFLKQAVICVPEGTEVECQVTGNCCCFFDAVTRTVSCVFNFCVVIQSKVTVRILVPSMGLCAPKECRSVVGGCPPGAVKPCRGCDDDCDCSDSKDC
ncbi:MAG TPA: hypothetical protein VNT01_16725 [Symbiobacteriaceae bacterium]|nr:hypothetical protein [Symbiobacteriaceae bacterium]